MVMKLGDPREETVQIRITATIRSAAYPHPTDVRTRGETDVYVGKKKKKKTLLSSTEMSRLKHIPATGLVAY
jgi:hypothetical protein